MKIRRREPSDRPTPADAAAIVRQARRLRFRVRRGAVADLAGAYLGARPGTGLAFSELRAYEPGDDVRHLDWNVTARQGKPYVRRFIEERALTLQLDRGRLGEPPIRPRGAVQGRPRHAGRGPAGDGRDPERRPRRADPGERPDRGRATPGGGPRHLARLVRTLIVTPAARGVPTWPSGSAGSERGSTAGPGRGPERLPRRRAEPVRPGVGSAGGTTWSPAGSSSPARRRCPTPGSRGWSTPNSGTQRLVDTSSRKLRAALCRGGRGACGRPSGSSAPRPGSSPFELSTADDPIGPLIRFFAERARSKGGRTRHEPRDPRSSPPAPTSAPSPGPTLRSGPGSRRV